MVPEKLRRLEAGLLQFGGGLTIAELIDPARGEVKPFTQQATGELVFTSLTREALMYPLY